MSFTWTIITVFAISSVIAIPLSYMDCKMRGLIKPKKGKKMNKKEMAVKIEMYGKHIDVLFDGRVKDADRIAQLQKEVNCAEDYGHDYVFEEKNEGLTVAKLCAVRDHFLGKKLEDLDNGQYSSYRYKCSRCNRTVDYTWDELTVKERNGLIANGFKKP